MDALRIPATEIAFKDPVPIPIKSDGLEGAGFFAGPASGAFLLTDKDHS